MADWRWSTMACLLVVCTITYALAVEEDIGQIKALTGEVYIVRHNVKRPAQAGDRLQSALLWGQVLPSCIDVTPLMLRRLLTLLFSTQFGGVRPDENFHAVSLIEHLRFQEGDARLLRTVTFADSQVLAG